MPNNELLDAMAIAHRREDKPYWEQLPDNLSNCEGWDVISMNCPMWLALFMDPRVTTLDERCSDSAQDGRYFQASHQDSPSVKGFFRLVRTNNGYKVDNTCLTMLWDAELEAFKGIAETIASRLTAREFAHIDVQSTAT